MADWCALPAELLRLISQHLPTSIDFLRFRSVCHAWREAVLAPPATSTRFPILPRSGICDTDWGVFLSKRTIYSLESPFGDDSSWIIKRERDNPLSMHLVDPVGGSSFTPLPANFPKLFNFLNIRVKELGEEYVTQYIDFRPNANSIGESGNLYLKKVAVMNHLNGAFTLLTIRVSGELMVYKSGDGKWDIIDDFPSQPYHDVILRQGKFYAVNHTGRVVVVDGENLNVRVVADFVFRGDKKILVDCEGELLLVDVYLILVPANDIGFGDEFYLQFDCFMGERTVKFKVYRLDETCKEWVRMRGLGDRMLFLGDHCTFSGRASEIFCDGSYHGNCIFFTDQFSRNREEEDGGLMRRGVGVFDMETRTIKPMGEITGAIKMFWPPPDWVESAAKSQG